jgi:hypothetical protein
MSGVRIAFSPGSSLGISQFHSVNVPLTLFDGTLALLWLLLLPPDEPELPQAARTAAAAAAATIPTINPSGLRPPLGGIPETSNFLSFSFGIALSSGPLAG